MRKNFWKRGAGNNILFREKGTLKALGEDE